MTNTPKNPVTADSRKDQLFQTNSSHYLRFAGNKRRGRRRNAPSWAYLAAALILNFAATPLKGADGTFISPTDGTWSNSSNWADGVVASGAGSTATLSGISGKTITLDSPVMIGSLFLNGFTATTADGRWILSGSSLTFDSGAPGVKSVIDLGNASNPGSGQRLEIGSVIAGSSGLEIKGGALSLTGTANTFTGGIDLKGRLLVSGAGSLNGNSIHISHNDSTITFGRTTEVYTSNIVLASDGIQFLGRGADASVILSGDISEEGGRRDLVLSQGGVALTYFRLRGNNSYTGDTIIGRSGNDTYATVVQVESNTAFGTGASTISFSGSAARTSATDAVWLNGGVTITDKKIVLRGGGLGSAGSLRARTGNNTWAGEVDLGTVAGSTIGVDSGASLSVTGIVTGSASGGLQKAGAGTLILSGNNTYSTGTVIKAGRVVAAHQHALGSAAVTLEGSSILEIAAGTHLEVSSLSITSNSRLAFNLESLSGTYLTVAGNLTGAQTLTIDIAGMFDVPGTYALLSVGGTTSVKSFLSGSTLPEGSFLDWNSDTGMLTLTVIPEASTTAMLAIGFLAGAVVVAGKRMRRDSSPV